MGHEIVRREELPCGCVRVWREHDTFPGSSDVRYETRCEPCDERERDHERARHEARKNRERAVLEHVERVSSLPLSENTVPLSAAIKKYLESFNSSPSTVRKILNRDKRLIALLAIRKTKSGRYVCDPDRLLAVDFPLLSE